MLEYNLCSAIVMPYRDLELGEFRLLLVAIVTGARYSVNIYHTGHLVNKDMSEYHGIHHSLIPSDVIP